MSPNNADRTANSVDPDQTAPLIWVCTVCPGISVRKLRTITVLNDKAKLFKFKMITANLSDVQIFGIFMV